MIIFCKCNYICKLLLFCYWVIFRCTVLASILSYICVQWFYEMWHIRNGKCLKQKHRWILETILFFSWAWCIICFTDFFELKYYEGTNRFIALRGLSQNWVCRCYLIRTVGAIISLHPLNSEHEGSSCSARLITVRLASKPT